MSRRGPESPPFHSGPPPASVPGPISALREHPRRRGRYVLEVGGGILAPVSVEMIAEHGLRVGLTLDGTALERLARECAAVSCFDKALDALARRARSRADLERWLRQRDHSAESVTAAVERLGALGLLDDEAFARGFVRTRMTGKGFGPRRVAAELSRRGVAREVADRVIAELTEEADAGTGPARVEVAAAQRARAMRGLEPAVAERRLLGWLVRRGFGIGEARRAAKRALAGQATSD